MTPLAQRLFRTHAHQINTENGVLPRLLAEALCFEISGVLPIVGETITEFAGHRTHVDGIPCHDHGGLLFMPAPVVWLEYAGHQGRLGLLLTEADEEIGVRAMVYGMRTPLAACLQRHDGDLFAIRPEARLDGRQNAQHACEAAASAAAALMLINAPRGVLKKRQEVHKGLAREAKRYGLGPVRPPHKIVLDLSAGYVGEGGTGGQYSERAFHFCRSHVRRISDDRTALVRGHWRGNPAVGVATGDYVVRR